MALGSQEVPEAPLTRGVHHSLAGWKRSKERSKAFRIKRKILREKLVNDPDKLAGTMTERGIVAAALRTLQIIVLPKGLVVLHDVMRRIDQGITENTGAAFGHSGVAGAELTGLTDDSFGDMYSKTGSQRSSAIMCSERWARFCSWSAHSMRAARLE